MRNKSPLLWTSLMLIVLTSCGTFQIIKRQYRSGYYLSIKKNNQPISITGADRCSRPFTGNPKYESSQVISLLDHQPGFPCLKLPYCSINRPLTTLTQNTVVEKENGAPRSLKYTKNFYTGDDSKEGDEKKNWAAVTGFICAFFFPVLGIIFSAIGLKSQKHGLAVAGLVLSIIFTVLLIMLL